MSDFSKAMFSLISIISIPVVSVLVMIYGWGLEPTHWGWIVGGYFWMMFVSLANNALD